MSRTCDSEKEHVVDLDDENDKIPETTEPVQKKTKIYQKRSNVWPHFEQYVDKLGVEKAKCNYCMKSYKCESKSQGTSNLKTHLTKCAAYLAATSGGQTQLAFGDDNKLNSWKFDQKIIRKGLAYMIITDELPFSFVEKKGFRYFMSLSQPQFKVPCRATITKDIYAMFKEEKSKVVDFIKNNVGRVCLTTDTWTSGTQSTYMCLTAHFIDNEWKLRKKVLSFCRQEGHRGVDIGRTVEKCLKEWGIENVFTISVDNASSNDAAIDFLKRVFQSSSKCLLNAKWTHIRCVAHIVNLVVQDGIKHVNESVEKIKWAVKWIRDSPSRIDKFNNFAKLVGDETSKQLTQDVATRWNSTYLMLDVAQRYKKTFERYDIEESEFKSKLEKAGHKEIKDTDWQNVDDLCHFLKPFYQITLNVSATHTVTSNSCIDEIYSIRDILDNAISSPGLCKIAMAMKSKFDKYFGNLKKMNLLLYFALILDPRNRLHYLGLLFEHRYGKEKGDENKDQEFKARNQTKPNVTHECVVGRIENNK